MQRLQDSVFSITKTTSLSPAVFTFLQPSEDYPDKTPLGGILTDTKLGWLALGPKFCVVDLRTGLKVAAHTFGTALSNFRTTVTSVVELPTPLTDNSQQLIISLECEDIAGMICVFHINGSQILRCIQTDVVVTELAICDGVPDGPFTCFDGVIMAGTKSGEVFAFDLNRASLIQALKDISQGYEQMIRTEENAAHITFLPLNAVPQIEAQRELALENADHIAVLLNENSLIEGQYIFRNPDGTVRMKAKRDHIRVTVLQFIPQLGSLAVGFNFGAFQIWNLMTLDLEFTSQVNVECLPVTHFGFQEPCDDPRAFGYLWVVFSVIDRFEEEEFPLAVMYSLTYQGKRMLSDTKCLYQDFLTATIRFQVELSTTEEDAQLVGGKCVSCHTYSVNSTLGAEGEESMLNICQLVWECWRENADSSAQHGMLLFDLDQWYKDQMPETYQLQSNAFMSATSCPELARGGCVTLGARLVPSTVSAYSAASRLEEHFYPNSLHYSCICLNTSESCVLSTIGIQRQIINSMDEVGPTALLNPTRLYHACVATGLAPLYLDTPRSPTQEEQRRYLLSVALEARLARFLKRCAHDWATGSHNGVGCTLTFLVDWCWKRAIELKENARELTAPLFTSSALPDRNVVRCLEHCVQQLTQLTGLLDAVLTKCCNLVVPDALSEMEEKFKGIGTVSLYFQVVQWFLRCGLLPERSDACAALPYPGDHLANTYSKRRLKLHRLQDHSPLDDNAAKKSCSLLYIDQLIEQEFGGERIHQMWIRGGSECHGLYPPPSLYSLLRLYLMPDIPEEHKHSLVLYLLVDYSMVYDEVRYEAVIRRLMQFPTMFGLSNTAIKATQAFWHLDHRDFDFALDQLQCLTGNTLSDWQHSVVLSSLLAQKKTQAALQYLHVRKPAPIQQISNDLNSSKCNNSRVNDHDKLDDWQSCCNLYLARGLVFEALDVIRMCVQNAGSFEDKAHVLNFFFKGCRNTGQLSKLLQATLLPFEEEMFIRYLENCAEPQTSDILIMYYLQQARYLEAEQYNNKLKLAKPRKDLTGSVESLADVVDREGARDTLVEVVCSSLPAITNTVAHCAFEGDVESHVLAPKPMSVYVQAKSPKNTFTYKSSFIQDTIGNASETWLNKPKMRRGIKRALNIEDTPFICTPKLSRNRSIFTDQTSESTPPKRVRLDLSGAARTPKAGALNVSAKLSRQMEELLDMPEVQSPDVKLYERTGADTPHSILKIRSDTLIRDAPSPVDSRFLGDSDDEMLETASDHTHYSDSTNKHLRFTIPTASESGSTPSPPATSHSHTIEKERDLPAPVRATEIDVSIDSYVTTESRAMNERHPFESPPKKLATPESVKSRKPYKDSVRARRSLSISANSSLSEDPNTSIESIADFPITLINPRYSGEKRKTETKDSVVESGTEIDVEDVKEVNREESVREVPKTPRSRRGIRLVSGESTPLINRSRSVTPERLDSPVGTPLRPLRMTRSRSRTPDVSPRSSPLDSIPEQPKQEVESEPHPLRTTLSAPRQLRSRSRTPERTEKAQESPRLEAITESPTKSSDSPTKSSDSPSASPVRRSLRSRSRTPEVEIPVEQPASPRSLRNRAKTPEKLMSPKKDTKSAKKSLSRIVLEANAFAKTKQNVDKMETDADKSESILECTPMKALKPVPSLMDVTFSPIMEKSILQSPDESVTLSESAKEPQTVENTEMDLKSIPAITMNESRFGKSVLNSYESSVAETSHAADKTTASENVSKTVQKSLPASTFNESCLERSVLHSYQSSIAESSAEVKEPNERRPQVERQPSFASTSLNLTGFDTSILGRSVLGSYSSLLESSNASNSIICVRVRRTRTISSLITSDSDAAEISMRELHGENWKLHLDSQRAASVIQKEKERIVEIEREINELEEDISDEDDESDESDVADESDSGDEEIVEVEEQEGDATETEASEAEATESETSDGEAAQDNAKVGEGESETEDDADESVASEAEGEESEATEGEAQERESTEDGVKKSEATEEESEESDESKDESEESEVTKDKRSKGKKKAVKDKAAEKGSEESADSSKEVSESDDAGVISLTDTELESSTDSSNKLQIDEQSRSSQSTQPNQSEPDQEEKQIESIAEVNVDKESAHIDDKGEMNVETKDDKKEMEVDCEDPLVEGQISIMTDDNSVRETDQSAISLHYSDEKEDIKDKVVPMDTDVQSKPVFQMEVTVEVAPTEINEGKAKVVEESKPREDVRKNVVASKEALTVEIDVVDTSEPESSEKIAKSAKEVPILQIESKITDSSTTAQLVVPTEGTKVVETVKPIPEVKPKSIEKESSEKLAISAKQVPIVQRESTITDSTNTAQLEVPSVSTAASTIVVESVNAIPVVADKESVIPVESKTEIIEKVKPAPRTKRTQSTSSNKSTKETIEEKDAPKTPMTRKRSQSTASNKSVEIEEKTPENTEASTPSRRRAKTPTSTEVRKILTRRASKELSQKLDASQSPLDESVLTTPKRRSTRSRSKNIDDNASVASESSVKSSRSKASEDAGDIKGRKGRKSVLPTKPDLSVIPEVATEEGPKVDTEELIKDYSMSRRLTRHQKSVLESWLEPKPARRRPSAASKASATSEQSHDDDDSSTHSGFDVQSMDRINLLNKGDFEGSPDSEEMQSNVSPESLPSDASKMKRSRARAASESKATPKLAGSRRISVDVAESLERGSPTAAGVGSPSRGRRASFNRACEALHTPKGRRTSTDLRRADTDSQPASPAPSEPEPATPGTSARRGRRASTHSNASAASDQGKRTKRAP